MKYTIDINNENSGGYCDFYSILEDPSKGFKQFNRKDRAIKAYRNQQRLYKVGLAPKIYGPIRKMPIEIGQYKSETGWGYITEKANGVEEDYSSTSLRKIQKLVDKIREKTGLQFWDCHWWNIGLIKRNGKPKIVCIDTGSESFHRDNNSWGFSKPGPKCNYCNRYQCKCGVYYDD